MRSTLSFSSICFALLCNHVNDTICTVPPYQQYILSPPSRDVQPLSIAQTTGNVTGGTLPDATYLLTGPNATVTYDFGQMVAGIPSFVIKSSQCDGQACSLPIFTAALPGFECAGTCQALGVSYTEAKEFIGTDSDQTVFYTHDDGTLFVPLTKGTYTVPAKWGRGSFRYLTLSLGSQAMPSTNVLLQFEKLEFTAAPQQPQLQKNTGYFYSSDDLLNRIWYAGAYTIQLCDVAANSSVNHEFLIQPIGWADNAVAQGLSGSDSFLVDGAKRDRNAWSGDVSISLRSAIASHSQSNLLAVRNVVRETIILQDKKKLSSTFGYFPYAGSPLGNLLIKFGALFNIAPYGSDTYHLWTMLGFAEYVFASGDKAFGAEFWPQILTGIKATYAFLDSQTGLFNGTRTSDWGRVGQGGKNTALNALYYRTLVSLVRVAPLMPANANASPRLWKKTASRVKNSMNSILFDSTKGLYYDNTTAAGHQVYPQDGNSLAIQYNIASPSRAVIVAKNLASRLSSYGAPAPELPGSISPFMGSHELMAQFIANPGNASSAMDLIRTQWGYMLEKFSNSTFIEGYGSNGQLEYGFYPNGAAFISHAHAWSTGPTYTLMHYIVGLQASGLDMAASDGAWAFKPAVAGSGLTSAEGGFQTSKGQFAAAWNLSAQSFNATVTTPRKVFGTIYVPTLGRAVKSLLVDGKASHYTAAGPYLKVPKTMGGKHSIQLFFS